MRADDSTQTVLFPTLADRPVLARFDEPHSSSDGGAVLVKASTSGCGARSRRPGR